MKKIKFAIIGCGQIAQRHAEHIGRMGILSAVCDINGARADKLGNKYNAVIYKSIDTLLRQEGDLNVVSICTPNYLHEVQARQALQAGFHVLCEKPMAIHVSDCKMMIETAKLYNRHLFVVHQNRFNPPVQEVKKLIDKGRLGKIFSIQVNCFWNRNFKYYQDSDWRGDKEKDGGTLFTIFSHFIDLLYWMIGEVVEVHSMLGNFKHPLTVQFEDT